MGAMPVSALPSRAGANAQDFDSWLKDLRQDARGKGISQRTIDDSLAGLQPIDRVLELDRKQPEFTLTFRDYLARVVNDARVEKGRKLLDENRALLEQVSRNYGVQQRFIVALWGIESDFGRLTGGFPVIAALATLAYDGRRSTFFRQELMNALRIIDQGHINVRSMTGSWAGAMGQSQFMPSSFLSFAVDYDGDGKRDIWTSLPDVFGSIANYLSKSGWNEEQTWGRPVSLPPGFPNDEATLSVKKTLGEWNARGVRKMDGSPLPARDLMASVIKPGDGEDAFLAYENYRVIMKWNRSQFFATAVGTLSDRLAEGG
ncbi:MAG: lytic murein transglycosylase [Alphaproteobacteria bacterium]|nr:lytic murein transglycosylase [Alphaproteobacteria bacterium]